MATLTATQFKTHFLTLLNEAEKSVGKTTITKRGKAVAKFGPPKKPSYPSPLGRLAHLFPDFPDMKPEDYDMPWSPDSDRLSY